MAERAKEQGGEGRDGMGEWMACRERNVRDE